jgi:hypothetical protein
MKVNSHKDLKYLELILEEIEFNLLGSDNAICDVYMDRDEIFYVHHTRTNDVHLYKYTKPYADIVKEHRYEILKYRLAKFTSEDEVCAGDIFMHSKFVELVNDKFTIDYDKKTLILFFEDGEFRFDLNDGDVGEFWNSLTIKEVIIMDINFHQEDKEQKPTVCLYAVKDGQTDTSDEIVISEHIVIGNPDNYFGLDIVAESEKIEVKKPVEVEIITILKGGIIESQTLLSGVNRVEVAVKIIREQMIEWGHALPIDISNDDMENECYELLDGTGKEIKWESSALTECS